MSNDFEFTSKFIRGQDLPEGQPVPFTAIKNRDGQVWGWRESKSQFGAEVKFPDGSVKKLEFFVALKTEDGENKEFSRNSKGFWTKLKELDIQEGDKVLITRIGQDRDARYSIVKGQ